MKTSIQECLKNEEVLALSKNPEALSERFGIPIVQIQGVKEVATGRIKSFQYREKSYKRIELIAKAYYEAQGFEASWSEGVALLLAKIALYCALAHRVRDYFIFSDERIRSEYADDSHLLEIHLNGYTNKLEQRQSALKFGGMRAFDELRIPIDYLCSGCFEGEILAKNCGDIQFTANPKDIHEQILKHALQMQDSLPKEELLEYMNEYNAKLHEVYEQTKFKYRLANHNEWSAQFALRIIEVLGPESLLELAFSRGSFVDTNFDITVLDVQNKSLKFVEVKNTDPFTDLQLLNIEDWIEHSTFPIELCLVQTEKAM